MNTKLRKFLDKYLDKYHKGFYIEKYILNDGKKHPVAIYSAFVVHYNCGVGKEYPAPQL